MGQFSSKSDHTNGADGIYINSEAVENLKYHYKKSVWLKHISYDQQATISQVPASGPVNENKKLRSAIEVEVFDPTPSEATESFLVAFRQILHKDGINVKQIAKVTDGKTPVVLICNMASRLEADIDRVLSSVRRTDYSRIVLIALHVMPKHALPQEGTKEQLSLQEEKYYNLRGVVDIAFTTENKFYKCPMNDVAVSEIRRLFAETL
ncbi:uncharacterized protein LOC128551824 isoform X2 [Mercenaria mercenaria]|uniref:uncharacterized protein LOC128551824 isoform X2 n=1 Tax=Mercenaria mercenaria TaxID=6596 RepID=UPI00234EEED4|nr:uncharacterized protein LOC128551824 isoform X2 [Mercenaria mercenaria]XP_053388719.1 uncharacterized protein LOC128551824 isoform X2 [Mercenaria mercenaria]